MLSLCIILAHFFSKEQLPMVLSILLGYVKIITLFKIHFKISPLLFYFITILTPKLMKTLQFSPNNINFKEK